MDAGLIHNRRHRMTNLQEGTNTLTVVRHPLYACSSAMVKKIENNWANPSDILSWYIRFMNVTLERFNDIYVAKFEDVINDVNSVIRNYSLRFNLSEPKTIEVSLLDKNVTEKPYTKEMKLIENEPNYTKAVELYERVIGLLNDYPNHGTSRFR